jgi:hypothetical protein
MIRHLKNYFLSKLHFDKGFGGQMNHWNIRLLLS